MGILSIPVIGDVIDAVKDIVLEAIPDADKKREVALELERIRDEAEARASNERIAQIEVNKTEARHRSVFVAGWRPFVGWVGGAAFAWAGVVAPLLSWIARVAGYDGTFPELDNGLLVTVLGGMLGFGAMRSYDKKQGTSNDVLPIVKKKGQPENILPPLYAAELPEDAPWTR